MVSSLDPVPDARVVQIATVGPDLGPPLAGVTALPAHEVVLVAPKRRSSEAETVLSRLSPLDVGTEIELTGADIVSVMGAVRRRIQQARRDCGHPIVNVGAGSKTIVLGGLLAAYTSGVPAFDVEEGEPVMLPLLEMSATERVSDAKLLILRRLQELDGQASALGELADACDLAKGGLSYHIRGSRDSVGLEEQGLVEVDRAAQGRLDIRLSDQGRLILLLSETG